MQEEVAPLPEAGTPSVAVSQLCRVVNNGIKEREPCRCHGGSGNLDPVQPGDPDTLDPEPRSLLRSHPENPVQEAGSRVTELLRVVNNGIKGPPLCREASFPETMGLARSSGEPRATTDGAVYTVPLRGRAGREHLHAHSPALA